MWYIYIIKSEIHHITERGIRMNRNRLHFNPLALLSLLALLALLAPVCRNTGMYGFLGFLVYLPYWRVLPDELFLLNLRRAATAAFLAQTLLLVAALPVCVLGLRQSVGAAFGVCFAAGVIWFSLHLSWLEWKEKRGQEE